MVMLGLLYRNEDICRALTGLQWDGVDKMLKGVHRPYVVHEQERLKNRPGRKRAVGGGSMKSKLREDEVILLGMVFLRTRTNYQALGELFGVSAETVGRLLSRIVPLLERTDFMRFAQPDPGHKRRRTLAQLRLDIPGLDAFLAG
jgi:hypothetical protein